MQLFHFKLMSELTLLLASWDLAFIFRISRHCAGDTKEESKWFQFAANCTEGNSAEVSTLKKSWGDESFQFSTIAGNQNAWSVLSQILSHQERSLFQRDKLFSSRHRRVNLVAGKFLEFPESLLKCDVSFGMVLFPSHFFYFNLWSIVSSLPRFQK